MLLRPKDKERGAPAVLASVRPVKPRNAGQHLLGTIRKAWNSETLTIAMPIFLAPQAFNMDKPLSTSYRKVLLSGPWLLASLMYWVEGIISHDILSH